MTWRLVPVKEAPPARYEHSAVIARRRGHRVMIVIFGAAADSLLHDMWSLDLGIVNERCIDILTETFEWTRLESRGSIPCARTLHTATLTSVNGRDRIHIFGGGSSGDIPIDDDTVYCLDLGTR